MSESKKYLRILAAAFLLVFGVVAPLIIDMQNLSVSTLVFTIILNYVPPLLAAIFLLLHRFKAAAITLCIALGFIVISIIVQIRSSFSLANYRAYSIVWLVRILTLILPNWILKIIALFRRRRSSGKLLILAAILEAAVYVSRALLDPILLSQRITLNSLAQFLPFLLSALSWLFLGLYFRAQETEEPFPLEAKKAGASRSGSSSSDTAAIAGLLLLLASVIMLVIHFSEYIGYTEDYYYLNYLGFSWKNTGYSSAASDAEFTILLILILFWVLLIVAGLLLFLRRPRGAGILVLVADSLYLIGPIIVAFPYTYSSLLGRIVCFLALLLFGLALLLKQKASLTLCVIASVLRVFVIFDCISSAKTIQDGLTFSSFFGPLMYILAIVLAGVYMLHWGLSDSSGAGDTEYVYYDNP